MPGQDNDFTFGQLPEVTSLSGSEKFIVDLDGSGNYAFIKASNLGAIGTGITLSTPALTATVASSTQINLSWTDVANESSYKLEWSPNGSTSWTQIGGTIAAGTTTYNHTGLTPSTTYYYRVTAVGNGTTYLDSGFGTANATTSAGVYNGALTSVNKTAMTVSSGSFTATSLGTAAHAVADQYLPASQAGGFTWDITTGDNEYVVGFNVQNEDVIYSGGTSGFEYGCYISGGSFITYRVTNGGSLVDLSNNGAVGDKYKMDRDGSGNVTLQRFRSSTWSTLYTWPSTNTGTLYIGISPTNSSSLITISNMTAVNLHP